MPIVDAHTHIGPCRVFDLDDTEQGLLDSMNANQIDEVVLYRRLDTPDSEYEEVDRTEAAGETLVEDQPACRNEGYLYRAEVVMNNGDSYYTDALDIKRVGFSRICLHRD